MITRRLSDYYCIPDSAAAPCNNNTFNTATAHQNKMMLSASLHTNEWCENINAVFAPLSTLLIGISDAIIPHCDWQWGMAPANHCSLLDLSLFAV